MFYKKKKKKKKCIYVLEKKNFPAGVQWAQPIGNL